MKFNIHLVYSTFILALIVFAVICYHNDNVLENRINSLVENSQTFKSEKSFKEDYYITQQSHDTNMILVVFGVLTGIFSFFSYINVIERYRSAFLEIEKKADEQESKWSNNYHKILVLETELNYQIAKSIEEMAINSLRYPNLDVKNYLSLSFSALEKYVSVLNKLPSDTAIKNIPKIIEINLETMCKVLDNQTHPIIIDSDYKVFKEKILAVTSILNEKQLPLFNKIISKITFV